MKKELSLIEAMDLNKYFAKHHEDSTKCLTRLNNITKKLPKLCRKDKQFIEDMKNPLTLLGKVISSEFMTRVHRRTPLMLVEIKEAITQINEMIEFISNPEESNDKDPIKAIEYIREKYLSDVKKGFLKESGLGTFDFMKRNWKNKKQIGYIILSAYWLGGLAMRERHQPFIKKTSGRNTSADSLFWGKKIDDYFNECDIKNKGAKTYAYTRVRNEWKKEFPDLSINPVPSDVTLKKYWDTYKKPKK